MSENFQMCFGIGRRFDEEKEAVDWFLNHCRRELSVQAKGLIQSDFDCFLKAGKGQLPSLVCLDPYAGCPFALVFEVNTNDARAFPD